MNMQILKKYFKKINKFYLFNFTLVSSFLVVVILSFAIQFKVDALQGYINVGRDQITSYREDIEMLEVEWSYLTRPSRIRGLSEKFLENNSYSTASQIKTKAQMEKFYIANYEKKIEDQKYIVANF